MPLARILVFALALTHAVGLADLVADDACEEMCSDDGCDDCVPGVACRCHCPSAMPILGGQSLIAGKPRTPPSLTVFDLDQRMHASPDPREILHVPRLFV